MLRSFIVVALLTLTGCTSGDFKLVDRDQGSSLTIAKGSSGTRSFTLTAEGHYLNTRFKVTGSSTDSAVTATPSAAEVDTGSGGSVDLSLEVAIPTDFTKTLTSATLRIEDVNDAQSFASDSFSITVQ